MSQHMDALEKANHVRTDRARIKREIHSGETSVIDVLEARPFTCDSMSVIELFTSQPRWGRTRTNKFLVQLRQFPYSVTISELRELSELTGRERKALIKACKDKLEKPRRKR